MKYRDLYLREYSKLDNKSISQLDTPCAKLRLIGLLEGDFCEKCMLHENKIELGSCRKAFAELLEEEYDDPRVIKNFDIRESEDVKYVIAYTDGELCHEICADGSGGNRSIHDYRGDNLISRHENLLDAMEELLKNEKN